MDRLCVHHGAYVHQPAAKAICKCSGKSRHYWYVQYDRGLGTALISDYRGTDGPCHEGKASNLGRNTLKKLKAISSQPSVGMYKTGDCRRMSSLTSRESGLLLSCPVF